MQTHYDYNDEAFIQALEDGTFPAALFTHEAHLRLAWLSLRSREVTEASEQVVCLLKAYTAHLGASDKYNHTVTVAGVYAVHHFMRKTNATSFSVFLDAFPQLKYKFKELLFSHYSKNIFTLEHAKSTFMTPDLAPF